MSTKKIEPWRGNFAELKKYADIEVDIPLFIIFAEYMGYCSRFIKLAEKWCEGEIPPVHIQKVMRLECLAIKRQMMKDSTKDEIREWFMIYYEPILKEFDDKLMGLIN